MNILIIGGCGYIGSALYNHLKDTHRVKSVDLEWFGNPGIPNTKMDYDLLTKEDLQEYNVVILVAAHSSVGMCKADRLGALDNNVRKFLSLVEKLSPSQKFIYASSSCVYGYGDHCTERSRINVMDDLSATKAAIDSYMELNDRDVEYYGLRFGSVNGPAPNTRLDLMINKMTSDAANGEVTMSNIKCNRPILAMSDLVTAVEAVINCKEDKRGIYNVTSFNSTVEEIAKSVVLETDSKLVWNLKAPRTFNFSIEDDKFCYTFKWKPAILNPSEIVRQLKTTKINVFGFNRDKAGKF